ncbi:MAG: AraC family transcriptional regulator, partial [Gemmatimonadaceae bacterium]|nr:AraC family transcriptional regulator [Gemmatimonadaceae bacterium]
MRGRTIAVPVLADVAAYLETRGIAAATLLAAADVPPHALADRDSRIPFDAMPRAWDAAERLTGDPDVGLHSAEHPRTGALGILGYVLLTSATVGDALEAAARWFTVLNSGLDFRVDDAGDATRITLAPRDPQAAPLPRHMTEGILLGTVRQIAQLAGRDVAPRAVAFAHPAPAHGSREHGRLFGVPVRFGAEATVLEYPRTVRTLPIRSHQPSVRAALAAQAEQLTAALARGDGVGERARRAIAARLRMRVSTIGEVGRDLAMSARSIQSALQDEGTTFQALIDDV